jgi:hypothetical protein
MEYRNDPPHSSAPSEVTVAPVVEEALVSDARAGLTPAEHVERKLISLLHSVPLRGSRLGASRVQRPGM